MIRSSLIKRIRNLLTESKMLRIEIYDDREICFNIWEEEVSIICDLEKRKVYVDCEFMKHHLDSEMLAEINSVVKEIELSLPELQEWMEE